MSYVSEVSPFKASKPLTINFVNFKDVRFLEGLGWTDNERIKELYILHFYIPNFVYHRFQSIIYNITTPAKNENIIVVNHQLRKCYLPYLIFAIKIKIQFCLFYGSFFNYCDQLFFPYFYPYFCFLWKFSLFFVMGAKIKLRETTQKIGKK